MSADKSARLIRGVILCALLALACSDSTKPYESVGGLWLGTVAEQQDTTSVRFAIYDSFGPLEGTMDFGAGTGGMPFIGTHAEGNVTMAVAITLSDTARVSATVAGDEMTGTMTLNAASAKLSLTRQ